MRDGIYKTIKKEFATKEKFEERKQVCYSCEKFDSSLERCKECGCFIAIKAMLNCFDCPLGKWK